MAGSLIWYWDTPAKGNRKYNNQCMGLRNVSRCTNQVELRSLGLLGAGYWDPRRRGWHHCACLCCEGLGDVARPLPSHSSLQAQAVCSYSAGPVCTLNSSMAGATSSADDGQYAQLFLSLARDLSKVLFWWPCHFSTPDLTGTVAVRIRALECPIPHIPMFMIMNKMIPSEAAVFTEAVG